MSASSILVAVRGEQCDDEVVRMACEMLNSNRCHLHLLYVIEIERGHPVDAEIGEATAKGEAVLKRVEEVAKGYKCKTQAELVQARQAGSAVVQQALDHQVDAIVIGLPYRQRYGSFSLGDTVPYVLKNAPCKVMVWRDEMKSYSSNRSSG